MQEYTITTKEPLAVEERPAVKKTASQIDKRAELENQAVSDNKQNYAVLEKDRTARLNVQAKEWQQKAKG